MRLKVVEVPFKVIFHESCKFSKTAIMGRIPDRWVEYTAMGTTVKNTCFIPFKVPLNENLSESLPNKSQWFTPRQLLDNLKGKLGLVIDLTNTNRYYSPKALGEGIGYLKIFTEGHVVPSAAVRQTFFDAVDEFRKVNEGNDRLIGVHCTHGLNRTGYLVCRYMIDKMDFKPDDAINAFNEARGYSMERKNYLDDLRKGPSSTRVAECTSSKRSSASRDVCTTSSKQARHRPRHQRNSGTSTSNGTAPNQDQPHRTYSTIRQPEINQRVGSGHGRGNRHDNRHQRDTSNSRRDSYQSYQVYDYQSNGFPCQQRYGGWYDNGNGYGSNSSNWRSGSRQDETPYHRDDLDASAYSCDPRPQYHYGHQPVEEYGQFGRQYPNSARSSHDSGQPRRITQGNRTYHAPSK